MRRPKNSSSPRMRATAQGRIANENKTTNNDELPPAIAGLVNFITRHSWGCGATGAPPQALGCRPHSRAKRRADARAKQTTHLKTSSLADRIDRRDRAAPFARRLAAGVGSGIALPRTAAGRMGQARLAKQT